MNKATKAAKRFARFLRIGITMPWTARKLHRLYGQPNIKAASRVVVFPELGLVYNRIKKNANTSTIILLRQLSAGVLETPNSAKWNSQSLLDLTPQRLEEAASMHLFIIIRNPYERVLSAFLDKFRWENYQRKYGKLPLTPDGFDQFLTFLETGGMSRDAHWDLQTKLMFLPLDEYHSVIRFENYRPELLAMLRNQGISLPDDTLKEQYESDKAKKTGATQRLVEFYTPARAARVQSLFAHDFEALAYSVDFPVPLSG